MSVLSSAGIILAGDASKPVNPLQPYDGTSVRDVDTSTLTGKAMCGYQDWFNCEGDGLNRGLPIQKITSIMRWRSRLASNGPKNF